MAVICPTVTAENTHDYREQVERAASLAQRIHIDIADGELAPRKLINPIQLWWPDDCAADIHLMYRFPLQQLETLISLKPKLVVVHAEAEGGFFDFAEALRAVGIRAGVALLPETPVEVLKPALEIIDHVLVFGGKLGYQQADGTIDASLFTKVSALKKMKSSLEVAWDGGVNDTNARAIIDSGVDVLNVGGFLQHADDPQTAYAKLKAAL